MKDTDLAALLCSKLCHDLVSPVGALSNGVELLSEDGQDASMVEQVVPLLESSAQQTANRLHFFRLAFGAGAAFGARIDAREVQATLDRLFAGSKVDLVWQLDWATIEKDQAKILLNLAIIAGEGLLRGGRLTIRGREAAASLTIEAEGARVLIAPASRAAIERGQAPSLEDARAAPAYLARRIADEIGARLDMVEPADGRIAFTVTVL
ncbi:histidine phosphotransferase ChpT [Rhodothalassium salexigens DSM 2132]|uniref:Histidine phosphotransferase ChpT n=1 Tax=Rhodothalassium salexigens DSM 2132 TaxID=1188247 RepID=A0A4R2PKB6_RHOSA|nr:histidine phosphotransferase family protein [Rhodothalassium salexigens]MBB4211613.1 histidine phosphotransferase ChpT [Rhodothalassium salexigens DSM 2132]MBK1639564.1 hypothetical protein [Rhodothalassium salexigens DSM 2132]TCP34455.1 histidine phosphotransferase ChpT [Rhodothalassium salexigens DSM 2132]